jgi:hypothetical protein
MRDAVAHGARTDYSYAFDFHESTLCFPEKDTLSLKTFESNTRILEAGAKIEGGMKHACPLKVAHHS